MISVVSSLDGMMQPNLAVLTLIFLSGGFVRGATGFGGALVMILPLATLYSMPQAIAISILLELFGPLLLLRNALQKVLNHKTAPTLLRQFVIWSVLGLPFGLLGQGVLNSDSVGVIASIAIALMALGMLFDAQRLLPVASERLARGLGFFCGGLIALTGIGGPLAASYFLAAVRESHLMRAMMHLYATVMSIATILLMFGVGFIGKEILPALLFGVPVYIVSSWLGQAVTNRMSSERLKQLILIFILLSSTAFLIRFLPITRL